MKKKNKKFVKLKKALAGFLALVLVVGLTIAGTLAWLSTKSNSVTNVFTASKNIFLTLIEPDYDSTEAGKYKPDGEIGKDPTLVNTTGKDGGSEWVMLRVDYLVKNTTTNKYENKSYENELKNKLFTLTGLKGDNWTKVEIPSTNDTVADISGVKGADALCEFYVYNKALTSSETVGQTYQTQSALESALKADTNPLTIPNGVSTTPLFTDVKIMDETTLKNNNYYDSDAGTLKLPEFNIVLQGAAVKNEGDDAGMTGDLDFNSTADTNKTSAIVAKLMSLLADKAPDATSGQAS